MFVVISFDMSEAEVHGPFKTEELAREWAQDWYGDPNYWSIHEVQTPGWIECTMPSDSEGDCC